MDDLLLLPLFAGIGVAAVTGPLGCFVVWRRMAYFGDTLAHAALLGVALGVLLEIGPGLGITAVCFALAGALVALQRWKHLAGDTVLGILSHGALALGLVVLASIKGGTTGLTAYLMGDILSVTMTDIAWIYGGGAFVLVVLAIIWRSLLAVTVHEELARVEGVPAELVRMVFMFLIALVVAVAMKVVGVLLVTALLIIPAATARRFSSTPEAMAIFSALVGVGSVMLGLWGSLQWDAPTGPAIVVGALVLFIVSLAVRTPLRKQR